MFFHGISTLNFLFGNHRYKNPQIWHSYLRVPSNKEKDLLLFKIKMFTKKGAQQSSWEV